MSNANKPPQSVIEYSKTLCTLGLVSGMAVMVGLPVLVLVFGQGGNIEGGTQMTIIIAALIIGALLVAFSVFFGTVIPHRVQEKDRGAMSATPTTSDETD